MEKLFLIDAYALIYRSYYAFINNPRVNSKGVNTSAIMGFLNTLNEVIGKEQPDYMAVAFERGKTFRHEAYPQYKAQRQETPETIRQSVPVIRRLLEAYKIPVVEKAGFEADDVIGTLALKAGQMGVETYMLTPDKDYGQLVRKNVFMYRPRHGGGYDVLGETEIEAKYGIETPAQVVDILALMGDSADNFPGCPGVGEKTAMKLIAEFGSVDGLLNNTDKLKGKMQERVRNAVDDIRMSHYLATIRTDVPMELDLKAMKMTAPDETMLAKLLDELEFKALAKRMLNNPEKTKKEADSQLSLFEENPTEDTVEPEFSNYESLNTVQYDYKLVDNEHELRRVCDFLRTKKILSIDTETTSSNAIEAELVGISLSVEKRKAFYVSVPRGREEAQKVVNILKPILEDPAIEKVGQNIKYDFEVLFRYNVTLQGPMFDTMLAHYIVQPELHHNMDYMAETLLRYRTIRIEELIGPKGKDQKNMRELLPEEVYTYACEDADITLQLREALIPKLKAVNGEQLFHEIEMPLVPVLAEMELNGVLIDTESLHETSQVFSQRMADYEQKIYKQAGERFNISSPKQVGEVLFGKMRIVEKPKKTRTGQYVTSEEVLLQLKNKAPIVEDILAYRGMKKLLSTYVDALPKLVNARTGHIHTSFNQALTATGRLSSSDPNLQNIPVRTEDGREIRKCFIPEPGCLFLSADYSQIELRIMAHLSKDKNMTDAFIEGHDIHRATAAKIWHERLEDVSDEQRKKAKQANFGIIYGITAFGLSQRMDIPTGEAKQLIDDYFKTFPDVFAYMEGAKQRVREAGYAVTLYGRRRYLPDINSKNATVRGFAERNAINAPIQGSEADIIKVAMINIHRRFKKEQIRSKMILQVHDELNFSVYPEEQTAVEKIVVEEMQNACPLTVPLTVDIGWGANWLEAH